MFRPRCFGLKTLILISLTQTLELVLYAFAKSTTALRFCTLLPSFITLLSSSDTAWECFLLSSEFSSQEASPSLLELLSVRYTCPRKSRGSSEAIHHGFPHHCHFDRLIHPHESSSCLWSNISSWIVSTCLARKLSSFAIDQMIRSLIMKDVFLKSHNGQWFPTLTLVTFRFGIFYKNKTRNQQALMVTWGP